MDMINYALADSIEMVVRPFDPNQSIVMARYTPPISAGVDSIDPSSKDTWSSPGFAYDDMHTGRAHNGRDVTKSSKSVFDITNPMYKSLPTVSHTIHIVRAVTMFLSARSLPGSDLWEAVLAMNGIAAQDDTLVCAVNISPSVSTKRLARNTQHVDHCINAFPNASGCVSISQPVTSRTSGELDMMSRISDMKNKSINIKSYHTAVKAITLLEASCDGSKQFSIDYSIREGTLRTLEDDLFEINDEHMFWDSAG